MSDPSLQLRSWQHDGDASQREKEAQVQVAATLLRHKDALSTALQEVQTLKTVVKALESTVAQLQHERNMLLDELRASKNAESDLQAQVQSLTHTCERLTETIQLSGVENAHRVTSIESSKREETLAMRTQIDRLETQLLSTQHPQNVARPIPWNKISKMDGHPAHVLRDTVVHDARREERWLSTMQPDPPDVEDKLATLNDVKSDDSDDSRVWVQVCRRIYHVLSERRRLIHIDEDSPVEFLLRTRHEMVGEMVHSHAEVRRTANIVTELVQRLGVAAGSNARREIDAASVAFVEAQVELISAALSDLDYSLTRTKTSCFSDIDCAIHKLIRPTGPRK